MSLLLPQLPDSVTNIILTKVRVMRLVTEHGSVDNAIIRANNVFDVEKLLLAGADVTAYNNSAIIHASTNGHLEVVRKFLLVGADYKAQDNTAIAMAAQMGHVDVVNLLISAGADPRAHYDFPIRLASINGHVAVVERLLLENANADLALWAASEYGRLVVVEMLIVAGCNPGAHDNAAIRAASRNGSWAIVDRLLQHPLADPGVLSGDALLAAFQRGNPLVVERLRKFFHVMMPPQVN